MRITVKENGHRRINIWIPQFLFANRFTAWLLSRKNTNITYRQAWSFVRAFKKFRRGNGKWKLVEVTSSKGEEIEIIV